MKVVLTQGLVPEGPWASTVPSETVRSSSTGISNCVAARRVMKQECWRSGEQRLLSIYFQTQTLSTCSAAS